MNYLPGYLRSAAGIATSVITPFHHKIPETRSLPARLIATVDVPFVGKPVEVKIYRYDDRWHWYFVDAQDYALPEASRLAENDVRFFVVIRYSLGLL